MAPQDIEVRVRRVAEQALAEQHYVRPVDVLLGLGSLPARQAQAEADGCAPRPLHRAPPTPVALSPWPARRIA